MIFTLAWRNIWRNRRRTLISMSAIALGLVLVIVFGSLMARMMRDAKDQLDSTGLGHVEVTKVGWRQHRNASLTIDDVDALRAQATGLPPGSDVGARLLSRALMSTARGSEPVELHGVDFAEEQLLAEYVRPTSLRQGALPEPGDNRGVLVGDKLAERLHLSIGSKVRVMVQRADGEMGAELFRVRGVFHSLSPSISGRRAVVTRAALAGLLGVDARAAHVLVVQLPDPAAADEVAAAMRASIGPAATSKLDVTTYTELFPMFAAMERLADGAMYGAAAFVYLLVGLGILNTLLMSVLERTHELGVLQAIGTRPRRIVALILAESFWLATISVVIGAGLGVTVNALGTGGLLDYTRQMGEGLEMAGTVMRARFGTELTVRGVLIPTIYVYVMALLVGVYPAWRVARMRPADALRAT